MPPTASAARHNQLLSSLKADDLALLRPALRQVELPLMTVLEEAGEPVKAVYFFESGFASVVTGEKVPIEIGLIGREGMTGVSVIMHDDRSVNRTFMQAGGTARACGQACCAMPTPSPCRPRRRQCPMGGPSSRRGSPVGC